MYTPFAEVPSSSRKRQATQLQEEDWPQYSKRCPTGEQLGGYIDPNQHQGFENEWVDPSWNYQQDHQQQQQQPLQEQPYYPDQEFHEFFGIPPPMAQVPVQYDPTQFQPMQHQPQTQQQLVPQPQQQLLPEPQQQFQHYPQQLDQHHYPQHIDQQHYPNQYPQYDFQNIQTQPQDFQSPPLQYQTQQQQISPNDSTPALGNSTLSTVGSAVSVQPESIVRIENKKTIPEVDRKRQRKIMLMKEFADWWTRREARKREYPGKRPNFDKMKDTNALECVQGRLALVGNMTKYTLTVEEVRRRIEGAESMNISELNCLFRKGKKKNGADELRRLLWDEYGIEIKNSQRHSILQSRFTSILEGEARVMATDVDNYTQKHFPREEIAQMIVEGLHQTDLPLEMRKCVQGALNTLDRIMAVSGLCKPKTVGEMEYKSGYEPLDDKMEFYSDRTHGFGIINMNTWFFEAFKTMKLVQGQIENELAQQAAVNAQFPPMDQNFF